MKKNTPPVWPSLILWPLALVATPLLMVAARIRKGHWA